MRESRRVPLPAEGFIEAPAAVVWELISDVERHPEWWPRVVEVECEGLEQGCTYRELVETPLGSEEMNLLIEGRDELRNLRIRCLNTGTFVRLEITEAQGGTFVDGEWDGPPAPVHSVIDAVAGRPLLLELAARSTLDGLGSAAEERPVAPAPIRSGRAPPIEFAQPLDGGPDVGQESLDRSLDGVGRRRGRGGPGAG